MRVFSFLLPLFFCINSYGAVWAVISSEKAIIYADKEQTSPIGFLSKGKKIRIGEIARYRGRSLPIVVGEKIAYLSADDIKSSSNKAKIDSTSARLLKVSTTVKEFDSSIGIIGSVSPMSYSTSGDDYDSTEQEEPFIFSSFGLSSSVAKSGSWNGWKVNFEASFASSENSNYSIYQFDVLYYFNLVKYSQFEVRVFGGLSIVPYTEYEFDKLFKVNGIGAGYLGGGEILIPIGKDFALNAGATYQYLALFYDLPAETNISKFEPVFTGAKVYAGLSYFF